MVWDLLLKADPEGPSPIFHAALRHSFHTPTVTPQHVSLQHTLEKKSRTITGNFTNKRYDRLETKGYIKRSSQPPSMQDILYEITDAGKAALRAVGGLRMK